MTERKYSIIYKLGFSIAILGIVMFGLAIDQFSYRGEVNPLLSKIGMWSFVLWLPVLIAGIILIIVARRKNRKTKII